MLYLRIKEDSQQARAFAQYIKTLPFVEVVEQTDEQPISKEQFLADFKDSLRAVKDKTAQTVARWQIRSSIPIVLINITNGMQRNSFIARRYA